MNRRRFIALSSVLLPGIAGCTGGQSDDANHTGSPTTPTPRSTTESTSRETTRAHGYLDSFEQDLSRTTIEINVLELETSGIILEYVTQRGDSGGISEQIGQISGYFFKQVRAGWDVTRLNAAANVDGGPTFTWHAKAAWYDQYAAGEISADELSLRVIETATRTDDA